MAHVHIHITGIVQGVGFRPFVYREAVAAGISGWVANAVDGVHVDACAEQGVLDGLVRRLREGAPAAARVDGVDVTAADEGAHPSGGGPEGFLIVASDDGGEASTLVSPDIATCPDCLRELFDPADRRYHYPFINCTACGPRFTIVRSLPYDRPRTSMGAFEMCGACAREYADPLDRRFHAQPDACFACGPHIFWGERGDAGPRTAVGDTRERSDAIVGRCAELLAAGGIVAVKGLGGFHLACNASDGGAVARLRERKRRPRKPLAVMVADVETAGEACRVDGDERALLTGSVRPIVLLRRKAGNQGALVAENVAFDLPELGIVLPYTPLQHLLMAACAARGVRTLVMTSGNVSGDPIETDDDDAWRRLVLAGVADALLGNDRPILTRYDDSVARVVGGRTAPVRRARGYAPAPVPLPDQGGTPVVLACGPEQKATVALATENRCLVSQHIGDLTGAAALEAWHEARERLETLFRLSPQALACDAHPAYASSAWARAETARTGLPLVEVQHHHAHVAAAIAEAAADGRAVEGPVVGIAFDGTGAGVAVGADGRPRMPLSCDGTVWGGEVLVATLDGFARAGSLAAWRLPGGDAAVCDASRCAYALLAARGLLGHPAARAFAAAMGDERRGVVDAMLARGLNSPWTTSAGRLFDAVSALLGACARATYDGEPAVELEALAARAAAGAPLPPFSLAEQPAGTFSLDPAPTLEALLDGVASDADRAALARGFHTAVARAVLDAAERMRRAAGLGTVALSGGVFMNRILLGEAQELLARTGFDVLLPRRLPVNDGCVSYGQAAVARAVLAQAAAERV